LWLNEKGAASAQAGGGHAWDFSIQEAIHRLGDETPLERRRQLNVRRKMEEKEEEKSATMVLIVLCLIR